MVPQRHRCRKRENRHGSRTAYAAGHYMASLDLAKAFDFARPARALATMQWYGMPGKLAKVVHRIWGNQQPSGSSGQQLHPPGGRPFDVGSELLVRGANARHLG